jgi:hypothetical protein
MTNCQRIGSISNARAGREFETEALRYFVQLRMQDTHCEAPNLRKYACR